MLFAFVFSGRKLCNCGRRFKNEFSLYCHLQHECGSKYHCRLCSFKSSKLGIWYHHVKEAHSHGVKWQ